VGRISDVSAVARRASVIRRDANLANGGLRLSPNPPYEAYIFSKRGSDGFIFSPPRKGEGSAPPSKHLEIFAVLPIRHFGLEAIDLGVLDVDVIIHELAAQRLAKERIVL
jgi:hypothetical protein